MFWFWIENLLLYELVIFFLVLAVSLKCYIYLLILKVFLREILEKHTGGDNFDTKAGLQDYLYE